MDLAQNMYQTNPAYWSSEESLRRGSSLGGMVVEYDKLDAAGSFIANTKLDMTGDRGRGVPLERAKLAWRQVRALRRLGLAHLEFVMMRGGIQSSRLDARWVDNLLPLVPDAIKELVLS
jgi:hypothetical protein